ncbi:MAG: ABC transporter permease [Chloroflexi bacterium]|nr:ABC transporter permease [Chloroflexota bacterium]
MSEAPLTLSPAPVFVERPRIPWWVQLGRLPRRHPIGAIGAAVITLVILVALFAQVIAPYSPTSQGGKRLMSPYPETQYLLGTDVLGRDVFSRIIYGSRISLWVGIVAVGLALALGGVTGVLTGYIGGRFDNLVMRLVDVMFAFPSLVLAIVIAGLLGPSTTNAMLAIGIIYAPAFARVTRSSVLAVRNELYLEAARVVGGRDLHIIWNYILPNIMAPVIVLTTLQMSTAILTEASLSFLGLGTQPPEPSWGVMLNESRKYMEIAPWLAVYPGLAIVFAVLGFNFLGDGLRDALDPRLKE